MRVRIVCVMDQLLPTISGADILVFEGKREACVAHVTSVAIKIKIVSRVDVAGQDLHLIVLMHRSRGYYRRRVTVGVVVVR